MISINKINNILRVFQNLLTIELWTVTECSLKYNLRSFDKYLIENKCMAQLCWIYIFDTMHFFPILMFLTIDTDIRQFVYITSIAIHTLFTETHNLLKHSRSYIEYFMTTSKYSAVFWHQVGELIFSLTILGDHWYIAKIGCQNSHFKSGLKFQSSKIWMKRVMGMI